MKKVYVSWPQVEKLTQDIIRQITLDNWRPDYVVGITRGGLIPATLISEYFDLPMHTVKVSLRDHVDTESNCWMSEDAFGYILEEEREDDAKISSIDRRSNILIVDDINDTGATINWIKEDWQSSCIPGDDSWKEIWNENVRFAVLYDNESSKSLITPKYNGVTVNKHQNPQWIVFPWEEFWRHES